MSFLAHNKFIKFYNEPLLWFIRHSDFDIYPFNCSTECPVNRHLVHLEHIQIIVMAHLIVTINNKICAKVFNSIFKQLTSLKWLITQNATRRRTTTIHAREMQRERFIDATERITAKLFSTIKHISWKAIS